MLSKIVLIRALSEGTSYIHPGMFCIEWEVPSMSAVMLSVNEMTLCCRMDHSTPGCIGHYWGMLNDVAYEMSWYSKNKESIFFPPFKSIPSIVTVQRKYIHCSKGCSLSNTKLREPDLKHGVIISRVNISSINLLPNKS